MNSLVTKADWLSVGCHKPRTQHASWPLSLRKDLVGWKARRSCDKSNVTMPPCPSYLSMWQNHYTCFFHEYPPRGMFQAVGIRGYGARDSPVALAQKGSVSKRGPTQFSSIICTVYIYIIYISLYICVAYECLWPQNPIWKSSFIVPTLRIEGKQLCP